MKKDKAQKEIPAGLKYALLAMGLFRGRNNLVPKFKRPKAKINLNQMVNRRNYNVQRIRAYILLARQHGFRGSVREQAGAFWGTGVSKEGMES